MVVERTGRLVGRAVASVANLLDLRLAVVAGSVALGFGAPFFDAAQAEIDALARLDFSRGARIRPAGLGGDAPLVGAAAVGSLPLWPTPVLPVRTVLLTVISGGRKYHPARRRIPPVGSKFAYDSRQALPVTKGAGMARALVRGSARARRWRRGACRS